MNLRQLWDAQEVFFELATYGRSARGFPWADVILTVFLASGHVVVKLSFRRYIADSARGGGPSKHANLLS